MKLSIVFILAIVSVECTALVLPLTTKVIILSSAVNKFIQKLGTVFHLTSFPGLTAVQPTPTNDGIGRPNGSSVLEVGTSSSEKPVFLLSAYNSFIKYGAGNDSVQLILTETNNTAGTGNTGGTK